MKQILEVKRNREISEYQYTVICVDWIETRKPKQEDVLEIYHSVNQEKLAYYFINDIRNMLRKTLGYRNIPNVQKLPVYEYNVRQCWRIYKEQLLDSLVNNTTVQLTEDCMINNCTNKQTYFHTVNIRLVTKSDRVDVQVVPIVDIKPDQHSHNTELYENWYLYFNTKLCPFYTKSHREITEFMNETYISFCYIMCLIRKH